MIGTNLKISDFRGWEFISFKVIALLKYINLGFAFTPC